MKLLKFTLSSMFAFFFILSAINGQPLKPPPPGGQGGGDNPDPIICHWPPLGKVKNAPVAFKWEPVENATSYKISIFDEDGENTIMTAEVTSSELELALPNLNLSEGSTYIIKVTSKGNVKESNNHEFTLHSTADWAMVLEQLESDPQYSSKQGIEKALRKAEFFKEKEWNLEASKAHNISTNNVVDMMRILEHFETFRLSLFAIP